MSGYTPSNNPNAYYNFLPPFLQAYPNPGDAGQQEDITRLNQYLPSYNTTVGYLTPLEVDGSGVPTNLTGMSGPAGSTGGLSYSPPATPFMMVAYGQTSYNGIIQFTLMNGDVLPESSSYPDLDGSLTVSTLPDPSQYFFMPASDVIDLSRVTQVFYRQLGNNNYKFYDANLIMKNPTQSVNNYELFAQCNTSSGTYNYYSSWPMTNIGNTSDTTMASLKIRFQQNYSIQDTNLGAGSFYNIHDVNITATDGSSIDGFSNYNYYTGYGPGYPVNFNYGYTTINKLIISYTPNTDLVQNDTGDHWPSTPPTVNVYNSNISNIQNYIYSGNTNVGPPPYPNNMVNIINLFGTFIGDTPQWSYLTTGTCNYNNECSNSSDTYFNNNSNAIQAGIMQYLIYQFIPFQQLKTPLNSIVTDFRNTKYSYVTLPEGIDFTPQGYKINNFGQTGPTGPFGSFPVEIQNLIDGNTGATGYTTSRSSIISGWMNNPLNSLYGCSISNATNSYCGFLEYYDSLFGIPYDYTDTCSGMHKGPCPSGGYCVPNFQFLTTYNDDEFSPFICVSAQEGITTQNLNYYIGSLPANTQNINNITFPPYEPANPGPAPPKNANQPSTQASNLFFYIGIAVAVIVLIVVIWLIVKVARDKPEYKSYSRVFPQEPNLNPLNINAL